MNEPTQLLDPRVTRWAVFMGKPDEFHDCLTYRDGDKSWYAIPAMIQVRGDQIEFVAHDDCGEFFDVGTVDDFVGIVTDMQQLVSDKLDGLTYRIQQFVQART